MEGMVGAGVELWLDLKVSEVFSNFGYSMTLWEAQRAELVKSGLCQCCSIDWVLWGFLSVGNVV